MQGDLTIHEDFRKQLLAEDERLESCRKAIKKIRAEGHNPNVIQTSRRTAEKRELIVAKDSPSGEFIGWYKHDQKAGRPNFSSPLELEIEEVYKEFKKSLHIACPRSVTNDILGKRSGKKRQEDSLASKIIQENERLDDIGAHQRLRANAILKNTGIDGSLEYVRRVLRKIKK